MLHEATSKSVIIKCCCLLLTALHGCYGDNNFETCIAPTFKNTFCGTSCNCHEHSPGIVRVGDTVNMTIKPVLETDLAIRWWTANFNSRSIVGNDRRYLLENNNKTLIWKTATKGRTVFFINVTNGCGKSTKACFVVRPFCNKCLNCLRVDTLINDSRNIFEHENLKVTASFKSDNISSFLQWCFIGANNQRNCCVCDNTIGIKSGKCPQEDWQLQTSYGEECSYKITCLLTVKNIAMIYNGGVFVGEAVVPRQNKTIIITQVKITVILKNHGKYLPYIISGSVVLVGVIVLVAISHRIVHVVKARRRTSTQSYLSMQPSSLSYPVSATQEDVDSDGISVRTNDFAEESSQPNVGTPI